MESEETMIRNLFKRSAFNKVKNSTCKKCVKRPRQIGSSRCKECSEEFNRMRENTLKVIKNDKTN